MTVTAEISGRELRVWISTTNAPEPRKPAQPGQPSEPAAGESLELRVRSSRNATIPKHSDPSPRDPQAHAAQFGRRHRNVLYPVVDIDLTEEHDGTFDGVMELSHILRGSWSINPQYYPQEKKALAERLILPGAQLEHWENWFCYNDCNLEAEGFYLRRPVSVPPQPARAGGDAATEKDSAAAGFTLLSDFWEGRVELWAVSPDGMERFLDGTDLRTTPDAQPAPPQRPEGTWTRSAPQSAADRPTSGKRTPRAAGSRPVLDTALVAAVEYLLRSRRSKPESPMPRSMHLFYDYDARTFRQKSWLWTMGPAVSALLRAAERPAVAERFGIDTLHRAAREMADQTLAYQVDDPEHPADGILMCRYDFDQESSELYEAKYSPADSLFFVGWALLPLYAAGGERRYLDASVRMVQATDRILNLDSVVQQDYFGVEGVWKDFTMDESGFGMEGLADVYRATGEPAHRDTAERYLQNLSDRLERLDGLWNRNYFRHSKSVQPFDGKVRGMGWAMEAVTSAWRMGLGDQYLHKARLMADVMLANQRPDGAWPMEVPPPGSELRHGLSDPGHGARPDEHGARPDAHALGSEGPIIDVSEKGTALWSVLLYRFYEMSGEECYRSAARRALSWCMRHQYFGADPDGRGGLPGITPASGVVYRPYFKMSCSYAVAFFAHALMTELSYPV